VNGQVYTWDNNGNLTSNGTNTYTYGYNRIAQVSDPQTGYFLGDALGSVRQVADDTGEVNLVQSYSPYGEVISSVGDFETSYSYTGEMSDGTGLVFLRARYYDPATGRLVNKDTWGGDYNNPITLAKWLYANGNPVNNLDPIGQATLESLVLFTVGNPYSGKFKKDGSQNGDEYGNNRTTYNSPGWTEKEKRSIYGALLNISNAYYDAYKYELYRRSNSCTPLYLQLQKTNRYDVFLSIHGGPITFVRTAENAKQYFSDPSAGAWAYTLSPRKILIFSNATADNVERNPRWIVHEVGHAFENAMLETIGSKAGRDNLHRNLITRKIENEQFAGFHGGFSSWQYSRDLGSGEIFADMFIGWVYNQWEVSNNEFTPTAIKRSDYMEKNMSGWIMSVISER
jgi:RHS repeat-associated protein